MENTTVELTNEILNADTMDAWDEEKSGDIIELSLSEYLSQMLEQYGLNKKEAISRAEIDMTYGYQIFQGKKHPGRNVLLQLAFGMSLTVDETKRLLYYGNAGTLYPRVKRDAYLMYALHNRFTVMQANQFLDDHGEKMLQE